MPIILSSKNSYQLILKKERQWFEHAHAIVVTAEQLVDDYAHLHPKIDPDKYHTIRNSYSVPVTNVPECIHTRKPTLYKSFYFVTTRK